MRKFEKVLECFERVNGETKLPTRSDVGSAGYDFYSKTDYTIKPNEIEKVWTDVKVYMNKDEVLILDVRSSMGGKFMLANTLGIVDSTYADNKQNDGNIGLFLKNISDEVQYIHKGDRIGQGIFLKYLITDNDCPLSEERKGGFGSSGR